MTKERKLTISKDDYTSAFAEAIECLADQIESGDPKAVIAITMAITRVVDWAWKALEKRCADDE